MIKIFFQHTLESVVVVSAFLLALIWSLLIPIWHFPDEQAHFAQVQNYAEIGHDPSGNKDLSAELYFSQEKLSTLRNERGNNSYTGTPSFNITYSQNTQGFHEKVITNQPARTRVTYVKQESPHYPPLYYYWSAIAYRLVYQADLFTRIFIVRFFSVLLFAAIVYSSILVAKTIFPQKPELYISIGIAVGFLPMLMFVSAGINNDTLITLIAALIQLNMLVLLKKGMDLVRMLSLVGLLILGMFTKQTIYFLIPGITLCLMIAWIKLPRIKKVWSIGLVLSAIIIIFLSLQLLRFLNQGFWLPYWPNNSLSELINHPQLIPASIGLFRRIYQETFAWYWGVYRWLSLTLPINAYRLIKLALIISMTGWFTHAYSIIRRNKLKTLFQNWQLQAIIVLIFSNAVYFLMLFGWELSAILNHGFGHGIQGRYFFPLITSQMMLIIVGWWLIMPRSLRRDLPLIIFLLFAGFNIYSLHHVLGSYFDISNLTTFIIQASQYKPWFAKWPYIVPIFASSMFSLMYLAAKLVKLDLYLAASHNGPKK